MESAKADTGMNPLPQITAELTQAIESAEKPAMLPSVLTHSFASCFGENFFGSAVLDENGFGSGGPRERFRILVSMLNPFGDCGFEFRNVVENASPYRCRVISAKSRSTRLSQEQDVGVKCKMKRLRLFSQLLTAGVLWVA
jgi:hypothetical protein